jgi:hypothetical protein
MTLHVGTRIWIPCRVKPGPFSDERTIVVSTDDSDWSGFVNVRWLKSRGDNDNDQVLATVVSIDGTTFAARIRGDALHDRLFRGRTERAIHSGSLQA